MDIIEKRTIRRYKGFTVIFKALAEHDLDLSWSDDPYQLGEDIDQGHLIAFCACVELHYKHILLADEYLGQCIYKSIDEFINIRDGYFDDMVESAFLEGRRELVKLRDGMNSITLK